MLCLLARPDAILNSFIGRSVNTPHNWTAACFLFSFPCAFSLLSCYQFVYLTLICNITSFFVRTQLPDLLTFSVLFPLKASHLLFVIQDCYRLHKMIHESFEGLNVQVENTLCVRSFSWKRNLSAVELSKITGLPNVGLAVELKPIKRFD